MAAIIMATDASRLLLLLNWMSPTFPVGGFAYSHGLEWAIETGVVTNAESLLGWIADLIAHGSGWNDAVLFSACWDGTDIEELNDLALALCTSQERYLETTLLGQAFANAAASFAGGPLSKRGEDTIAYPIAAGMACREAGIARQDALLAWLQQFAASQVSVAVRLVPLGQSRGLEVLRDLIPAVAATAMRAANASLDDLGSIAIGADIAAMQHETLESRIFRT